MEDLGDADERFVEFFRCVEKNSTSLPALTCPFPPPQHGNLLAASSAYGYLFIATGDQIYVHLLQRLRDKAPGVLPQARLDLRQHNIAAVYAISLVLDDAALVVHALPQGSQHPCVLLLSTPALAQGNAALLPSPPPQPHLNAVAVRPQSFSSSPHAETNPQLIAMLYQESKLELYVIQCESQSEDQEAISSLELSFDAPDPVTCIALSPDDDFLAVGSMRGSVAVHSTADASLLATIVEVESGWRPFALHFLTSDALMVSYARGENTSHVIWNLVQADDQLVVNGHSPLGELCLPTPPTPPSSEDGDAAPENHVENKPPVIWCSRIPGWDVCVVASSLSTDVEVISLNDDGIWENWKFDEGKSATMPTDENYRDTTPVGIAFDLTDTDTIESPEPAAPRINPMPRLITFTSDSLLLPFVLIDDRPDAACKFVRGLRPLPPIPDVIRPIERITFQDSSTNDEPTNHETTDSTSSEIKADAVGTRDSPAEDSNERATALSLPGRPSENVSGWTGVSTDAGFATSKGASYVEATYPPTNNEPTSRSDVFSRIRKRDEFSSSSRDSASPNSVTDENDLEDLEDAVTDSVNERSEATQDPQQIFIGQEEFISAFDHAEISETGQRGRSAPSYPSSSLGLLPDGLLVSGRVHFRPPQPTTSTVSTVATPVYPPPPSHMEANAAIMSGKPIDLIKSVLLEMAEELNNNRAVELASNKTLRETNSVVMPLVESVRSGLSEILQVLRDRFRDEGTLRREVLGSLKKMMILSREYESTSLEFRVREEEGFASHLQAEDMAIDDSISKKEAEIIRAIFAIEERLTADRIPKERKVNPPEQIQQMYSSLSLQGIRVKKIHGLLSALSERIDELDKGGRRADLGLSMARLEKLSISNKGTPCSTIVNGSGVQQSTAHGEDENLFPNFSEMTAGLPGPGNIEGSLISSDVQKVLRRLAMRCGRADISVKGLPIRNAGTIGFADGGRLVDVDRDSSVIPSQGNETEATVNSFGGYGQGVTQVGMMARETSDFSFDGKSNRALSSASFRNFSKSNEVKATDGPFVSPGKRSASQFEEANPETPEPWSKNTLPDNGARDYTVPQEGESKKPLFASQPPDDFTLNKTTLPSQRILGFPSLSSQSGDESSTRDTRGPTEASTSHIGSFLSNPSLAVSAKKRTSSGESPSFEATVPAEPPRSDEKPPLGPPRTNVFGSQSPDPPAVKSNESLGQQVGSRASGADGKDSGLVAVLPPDTDTKSGTFATLPPDDSKKTSSSVDSSSDAKKSGVFASLPPTVNLKVAQFSSLPPEDVSKDLVATLPPDDDLKPSNDASRPTGEAAQTKTFASLPPDDDLKGSLIATLPPDDDIKSSLTAKELPVGTTPLSNDSAGKNGSGQQLQIAPAVSGDASLNPFGDKLSIGGGTGSAPLFGSKQGTGNEPESQENAQGTSLFGNITQSTSSQFPFGTGQAVKPSENVAVRDSTSDIQADSSDSDIEDTTRSTGGFGMTSMTTNATSQSAFTGFGNQFQGGQNVSSTSAFGQTSASPFGNTSGQFGQFGASSAQGAQGMSFSAAASSQGTGSSPFASVGASSSSFASPSPFGPTSQFGATSTLGGGASFGSGAPGAGGSQFGAPSQLGGGAQFEASSQLGSQFGASSQLGAGFGAQSPLGAGASPFAAQPSTAVGGFGSGASGFGGEVSAAKFGESGFGTSQQSSFSSGGGASPFAAVAAAPNAMFGGQSGGSSGFAALAASQPFGGTAGSGFGNGMTPVFGNNAGPPAFTSAAFSQRRA